MFISKKDRKKVYKFLIKEGACCAEKDFSVPKHPMMNVLNLFVIKLMQSFEKKNFVTERFIWRHYYWYLTDEGHNYLKEYLFLDPDIKPNLFKILRWYDCETNRNYYNVRGQAY